MNLGSGKGQDFLLVLPLFCTMKRTTMVGNFSATPTFSRNNHTQKKELELPLLLATTGNPSKDMARLKLLCLLASTTKEKIKNRGA